MAKTLSITVPLSYTITAAAGITNSSYVQTPDPKEAASFGAAATYNFDLDLGSVKSIDTFFLGYISQSVTIFGISYGTVTPADTVLGNFTPQSSVLDLPNWHIPVVLDAPVNARYMRLFVTTNATGATAGIIAVGKSVRPTWGHEFGSGRPVEDTGIVDRLFSGGFGIYEGVRVGGYQWTFGDLSDAELDALYGVARSRGISKSVLIVEDPTQSSGLNERTHWSLFDRLEAYERQVPGASRYAFKVKDWA